jgi:hypothetical protein
MERTPIQKTHTCKDCIYSDARMSSQPGAAAVFRNICRLNPPTVATAVVPTAQGQLAFQEVTVWPMIEMGSDWCGQMQTGIRKYNNVE